MTFDLEKMAKDIESKIGTDEFRDSLKRASKSENIYTADYIKTIAGRMDKNLGDGEAEKLASFISELREKFSS